MCYKGLVQKIFLFFIFFLGIGIFYNCFMCYNPLAFTWNYLLTNLFIYPTYSNFSFILLFVGVYFSFIIICLAENKAKHHFFKICSVITLFITLIIFYISTNNLIFFFYLYETFLAPSIYLVYYYSPNKRSLIATFYFLIWTQIGSFLVFVSLLLIINYVNAWHFHLLNTTYLPNFLKNWIFFFIFFGFGIKVPIWPFYYWLTKTHVEAPTFFSIYLSGFLVKTALYGFYKLFFFNTYAFMPVYLTILLFSVCDVSLKFFTQVDIKKIVAYGTVQEMNLIYLGLLFFNKKSLIYVSLFILTHAILSTIFFFIVDCLYKRYKSRSIYNIYASFNFYPITTFIIIFSCLGFNAFPGSLKFFLELFIFSALFEINFLSILVVFIILNWLGTVSFTYLWFRGFFGIKSPKQVNYLIDLTKKELLLFQISFFCYYQGIFTTFMFF